MEDSTIYHTEDNTRPDGSLKGSGWLGKIPMTDGSGRYMTELTMDVDLDGEKLYFPLIVPTLTQEELNSLSKGEKPNSIIIGKAIKHALDRKKHNLSPYSDSPSEVSSKEIIIDNLKRRLQPQGSILDLLASFNANKTLNK